MPTIDSAMKPWYQIDIDDSWFSAGHLYRLCRQFQRAYIQAGAPSDMALFAQRDDRERCRCLYVSPQACAYAADLLDDFAARPCTPPSSDCLTLLYGPPNAEATLFAHDDAFELAPTQA